MVRFIVIDKIYQDYANDNIGVSKDATVNENHPTWNYGAVLFMEVGNGNPTGSDLYHSVVEIQMPDEEDILGFGRIVKVELELYQVGYPAGSGWVAVIIKEIQDIWDEGTGLGVGPGECSWDDAQLTIPWKAGSGVVASREGSPDDAEIAEVIDAVLASPGKTGTYNSFDLTPALQMGDKKSFCLFYVERSGTGNQAHHWACRLLKRQSACRKPTERSLESEQEAQTAVD